MSWFDRMSLKERRKMKRQGEPELAAYYWNGAHAEPHGVRDISFSGLYLLTEERWHPGTVVMLTLQRPVSNADAQCGRAIRVQSKVVRWGDDGVAFTFLFSNGQGALADGADRKSFIAFSQPVGEAGVGQGF